MKIKKKKDFKEIWLNKIETKETALLVVKECVSGFFFVAALAAAAGFFFGFTYWIEAIAFTIIAALLWKFKHVAFAIFALILSSISLFSSQGIF